MKSTLTPSTPIHVPGASLTKCGRVHWMVTFRPEGQDRQWHEFSSFAAAQDWLLSHSDDCPELAALWDALEAHFVEVPA